MKKGKVFILLFSVFTAAGLLSGCDNTKMVQKSDIHAGPENNKNMAAETTEAARSSEENQALHITPRAEINQLEEGFSAVRYDGDYWFDNFLKQGGASSDSGVIQFLAKHLQLGANEIGFETTGFGCSTLAVKSPEGNSLFGRNFDWQNCDALVVLSKPASAYASISTVNMDFIFAGSNAENAGFAGLAYLPDEIRTMIALYAPLDGMNEQGLGVSVNMIQDSDIINQQTDKPDITTTTAIRLLLDNAANVEEALALLGEYDMHSSMGMMVHFALADRSGRSVAVEYINDSMVVTETPAVTNFYLAPGEKNGIGSSQSHERYETLIQCLSEQGTMGMNEVRDALDSVSKDNFGEFESTEWSTVFNLDSGEARYYHRENYENSYIFNVNQSTAAD